MNPTPPFRFRSTPRNDRRGRAKIVQRGILYLCVWGRMLAAGWFAVYCAQRSWLCSELGRAQREFAAENTPSAPGARAPGEAMAGWRATCCTGWPPAKGPRATPRKLLEIWGRTLTTRRKRWTPPFRGEGSPPKAAIMRSPSQASSVQATPRARLTRSTIAAQRLHRIIGRHDLYREQLRRDAQRESDPRPRALWEVEHNAIPIAQTTEARRRPAAAPDDDRVWLAPADAATRSGRISAPASCSIAVSSAAVGRLGLAGRVQLGTGRRPTRRSLPAPRLV